MGRVKTSQGVKSLGPFFHSTVIDPQRKVQVDRVIRRKAVKQISGTSHCVLFLNIQPQWLYDFRNQLQDDLPTISMIKEYGISGKQIIIEISESEFQGDIEVLERLIFKYREIGCRIAIDDVGCGFSNMDRIVFLKPDFLKIDASLVQQQERQEMASCLLSSMGLFAQKMALELIFEGVETREQFASGLRAGARYYQGYFFSHPVPRPQELDGLHDSIIKDLQGHVYSETLLFQERQKISNEVNRKLDVLIKENSFFDYDEIMERLINSASPEWFRLYVCDDRGFQKSPNYTRTVQGEWKITPEFVNKYWGWRPYYVPTLVEVKKNKKGFLSEPYLDLDTRVQTSTFCYPLTDYLFLFIDCSTEELRKGLLQNRKGFRIGGSA